jgi:hypothetical protein
LLRRRYFQEALLPRCCNLLSLPFGIDILIDLGD